MDSTSEAIEACIKALAYMAKNRHVADELRGAVWEFFLAHPKERCQPSNPRLKRFVVKSLQLASSFTDTSDVQVGPSGDEYSLIDLVKSNEDTPESLLAEAEDPTPEPEPIDVTQALASARGLLSWREEMMFRMKAEGMRCADIAFALGLATRSVYGGMTVARNRVKNKDLTTPDVATVTAPRIRLAPLCLRRG